MIGYAGSLLRVGDYTSISFMNRMHGSNCAMEHSSNTMRERSGTVGVQITPAECLPVSIS